MKIVSSPGDRADDLGPARLVERRGDALGRARGRAQHGQARPGRAEILDERAHVLEMARRERVFDDGQQVAVGALDDADFAQVAADARLGRLEPLAVQQVDELGLARHRIAAQDANDRLPSLRLVMEVGGHGLHFLRGGE